MNPKITLSTSPTQRLAGVEWMRGLAAFGVICLHSGLAVHNRTTPDTGIIRQGFDFAVPYFLIVSFFFAFRAEKERWIPWSEWMKRRALRLGLPFLFWSIVYLSLHLLKLAAHHQGAEIRALFTAPAALILSGGTSVALYFLPLLFTGLVLVHLLAGILRRLPDWALLLAFLAAPVLREISLFPAFTYEPGSASLPLLLGLAEDGIRCLPFIFAAGLFSRLPSQPTARHAFPFLASGLLILLTVQLIHQPALTEAITGLAAFFVAWGLSGLLAPSRVATLVGLYSFGVYLVHQVFLEALQLVLSPTQPTGILGVLAITTSVYLISMGTVAWASRGPAWLAQLFGLIESPRNVPKV